MASLTLSSTLIHRLQVLAESQGLSVEALLEEQFPTVTQPAQPLYLHKHILDNGNDGIWFINASQQIEYVNPRLASMLGYTVDEMQGKPIYDFLAPVLHKRVAHHVQERQTRGNIYIEVTLQRKDGSGHRVQVSASNVYNDDGVQIGAVAFFRDIEEVRGIETAVHTDLYQSVIDAMDEGIIVRKPDGEIIDCNDSALKILGISREELISRKPMQAVWQAFYEDGRPLTPENAPANLTIQTGEPQRDFITYMVKADGSIIWITINTHPLYLSGNETIDAVVSIFTDITEYKNAEAALRKSEANYRTLIENSPIASIILQFDENQIPHFAYLNDKAAKLYGAEAPADLVGKSIMLIVPDTETDLINQRSDAYADGAKSLDAHEFSVKRLDGEIRYVIASSTAIEYNDEHAVFSILTDVTSRREAEQALRDSEERLQLALSTTNTGIWEWDIKTNEVRWSKEVERIFGLEPGAFGKSLDMYMSLIHEDDLEQLSNNINYVLENPDKPYYVEHRSTMPDGSYRWISGRGAVFCDDAGKPVRMIGLAENITERKEAQLLLQKREAQINRQNEALLELATMQAITDGDLSTSLRDITRKTSHIMNVARISIWLYETDKQQILCELLYNSSEDVYTSGTMLTATDYPAYFAALQENRIIVADDACNNPATSEFANGYLGVYDIQSMLDAPVRVAGHTVGVVCCEHVTTQRQWSVDDQHFISSIADIVALAIEACDRRQAETALQQSKETALEFQQYLQTLHEIMIELSREDTLDDIYKQAVELGRSRLGFERIGLLLFDETKNHLLGTYGTDLEGQTRVEHDDVFVMDIASVDRMLNSKERAVLKTGVAMRDKQQGDVIIEEGWFAMSILWNSEDGIGMLTTDKVISQQPPRPFELDLLGVYANALGNLITQHEIADALRTSEETALEFQQYLQTVHTIILTLSQEPNLNDVYRRAVELARSELGFDRFAILMLDDDKQQIIGTFGTDTQGNLRDERDFVFSTGEFETFSEMVEGQQRTTIQQDVELWDHGEIVGKGWHGTALLWDGLTGIGWVVTDVLVSQRAIRPYETDLLSVYANALGNLITQRGTQNRMKQLIDRLTLLAEIDRSILRSDSPETIASATVGSLQDLVGCDYVGIMLLNQSDQTLQCIAHTLPQPFTTILTTKTNLSKTIRKHVTRGETLHMDVDDEAVRISRLFAYLRHHNIETTTIVPILSTDEIVGVIVLGRTDKTPIATVYLQSAQQVASQLSVALKQSMLLQRIQYYAESLEQKVKERTQQLEEKADEMEAFTYSVSHDLRAPLRAINGFSDLLLEMDNDDLPNEARHYLNRIHVNSLRMGQLIDDLLKLSRIGRKELKKQTVDTEAVVHRLIDNMRSDNQLGQATITIDKLPPCEADTMLLQQAYFNLITNAVKYSQEQEDAKIHIGFKVTEDDEVTYYVQDNGIGFDMKYADKLFGVFQRLHNSSDYEGTGIGLATVQRIINRHGGKVRAEATVGEGATFYFSLPKTTDESDVLLSSTH